MLSTRSTLLIFFFFFNDTATSEIYTLSLHDALPISNDERLELDRRAEEREELLAVHPDRERLLAHDLARSEEHTSELQSQSNLVCRLLLEKKKILMSLDIVALRLASHHPSLTYVAQQ